ncbi:hypothetical protein SS05631_b50970 (plasmid) [Sinorhizobium sp. CCBAU 05631]|nr:hypothetical protein SS05631_b50970 [Sinorhizobium sp. CCBAU 05631]
MSFHEKLISALRESDMAADERLLAEEDTETFIAERRANLDGGSR